MVFEESENSRKILDYFNSKYGQIVAPIGLAKACSIVSAKYCNGIAFNVFAVAPTRQFKSRTSYEAAGFFSRESYVELGSDFTMHGLMKHYNGKLNRKCLFINDGTLLLTSKAKKTKDRLINGLAELLADGSYHYDDFQNKLSISGRVSVVMNMTSESYERYKRDLLGSTFLERFTTLFYRIPLADQKNLIREKEARMLVLREDKVKKVVRNSLVSKYASIVNNMADEFSVLANKSMFGVNDQLVSLVISHACLNGRDKICQDDIDFLNMLRKNFNNPFAENQNKIIMFARQGRTQLEICRLLGKEDDYQGYVSRVIRDARLRGVLD